MLEIRLTEQLIAKMEALEAASGRLGWIGIGVGAVGVLVAIVIAVVST